MGKTIFCHNRLRARYGVVWKLPPLDLITRDSELGRGGQVDEKRPSCRRDSRCPSVCFLELVTRRAVRRPIAEPNSFH
jgi:hypothetical protein